VLLKFANDEGLIQLQSYPLRQTTLMKFQTGPNHNHRTSRVVYSLAKQVLTESTLLTLNHIAQRLQRPIITAEHRPATTPVVQQSIDRLLKHPFLVTDNHIRGIEVYQLLQPVVTIYDSPVKVIQVAGREITALKKNQRTQIRRDNRDNLKHHPFGFVTAIFDCLDGLKAFRQVLYFLLTVGLGYSGPQLTGQGIQVEGHQQRLDGLGAY